MSAVVTWVNNGDATVSTNPMALDLDGSIGVVPATNVDVADEALLAVVESTSRLQGNGVSVTEDHMDDASSHTISAVEDHLNELMRVLNYIHESIMMLQQEIRLHVDYLGEDE